MDLRNYAEYISDLVKKENDKDKDANWVWSIEELTDTRLRIRWGYLDYLEETENCFFVELDKDNGSGAGNWLHTRRPHGELIEAYLVVEGKPNPQLGAEQNIHRGLEDAIKEIAYIAHNYY